jgi:hypothetical protein
VTCRERKITSGPARTTETTAAGFLYYDFKVSKGKAEKLVSWTTGTGLIGPMDFEIGRMHYQLELCHSNKLGKLQDNQLVIWPANSPL